MKVTGNVYEHFLNQAEIKQHCPNRTFCDGIFKNLLSKTLATNHMWLLFTSDVASTNEEMKLQLQLVLINLSLSSHMWLMVVA